MENQLCYFCDIQYPHPSCLMIKHNGIYACYNCEEIVPINSADQDGECCVCFENKLLMIKYFPLKSTDIPYSCPKSE